MDVLERGSHPREVTGEERNGADSMGKPLLFHWRKYFLTVPSELRNLDGIKRADLTTSSMITAFIAEPTPQSPLLLSARRKSQRAAPLVVPVRPDAFLALPQMKRLIPTTRTRSVMMLPRRFSGSALLLLSTSTGNSPNRLESPRTRTKSCYVNASKNMSCHY